MAGTCNSFRQLEDKPLPAEIAFKKWSPSMDLLALVTVDGEVWLQRLSWKRVWSISTSEGRAVSVAWRPDGKILAVGFTDGAIKLFDVENAECIHKSDTGSMSTSMEWVKEETDYLTDGTSTNSRSLPFFVEKCESYLPRLPHLPKSGGALFSKELSEEVSVDPRKLKSLPEELNVLVVCGENGKVHLFLYGIFLCASVSTVDDWGQCSTCHVLSATLSCNLKVLSVVLKSAQQETGKHVASLLLYDTSLLWSHGHELSVIAKKAGKVTSLMEYLDNTVQSMSDAWEDILLEMDTKLTELAAERLTAGSNVRVEFLTLLTRGVTSPELQSFLIHDLTVKGLKKLGHSIENSYSNIQNLALKHLQGVTESILFHMTEVHGMSQWHEHFSVLGLSEHEVQMAIRSIGSIMLKTQELVQVINIRLKSFNAFVKWLFFVIFNLADDSVPDTIKQFSQQEISLVSSFIKDQLAVNSNGKFTLERVGQYFEPKPLTVKSSFGSNDFTKFVEMHPSLMSSPLGICDKSSESLVSLCKQVHEDINKAFAKPVHAVSQSIFPWSKFPLCEIIESEDFNFCVAQASVGVSKHPFVVYPDGNKAVIVCIKPNEHKVCATRLCVNHLSCDSELEDNTARYKITDLMFYDSECLSVLLQQNDEGGKADAEKLSLLAQVPLGWLEDHDFTVTITAKSSNLRALSEIPVTDIGSRITQYRKLTGIQARSLAVSGTRKVSSVLSASQRHIRLFDMDAEDEEADEDIDNDSMNTSLD